MFEIIIIVAIATGIWFYIDATSAKAGARWGADAVKGTAAYTRGLKYAAQERNIADPDRVNTLHKQLNDAVIDTAEFKANGVKYMVENKKSMLDAKAKVQSSDETLKDLGL